MPSRAQDRELQELVDSPNETLEVEYKAWLDLSGDNSPRADLARHIAALANHGGGKIVFGFNDDMTICGSNPQSSVVYDRDLIASIVKKYLEPTFQCDVYEITSNAGNKHPVVVIPPHGATPICARATGPQVAGRSPAIMQGVYYIRKSGPESAPVLSAIEWGPVIRRCAMHDRAAVLGAIDNALRGFTAAGAPVPSDSLKVWHDAAHTRFLQLLAERPNSPENLYRWHWQLSYAIDRADGQRLELNQLAEILRQVNAEVADTVRTGWSMFHIFHRPGIAPYFNADPANGLGDREFLECSLLPESDDEPGPVGQDVWRFAPDGMATLVRDYWEDGREWSEHHHLTPGTLFDPNLMVRSLAECVRHARGVCERFDAPSSVSFRCEWRGLTGRKLFHMNGFWSDRGPARTDHRIATGTWSVPALTSDLLQIISVLAAPVARLFGIESVLTPAWIASDASTWRRT
jgi:hypothetical protein